MRIGHLVIWMRDCALPGVTPTKHMFHFIFERCQVLQFYHLTDEVNAVGHASSLVRSSSSGSVCDIPANNHLKEACSLILQFSERAVGGELLPRRKLLSPRPFRRMLQEERRLARQEHLLI
jgi:hypothetical protein